MNLQAAPVSALGEEVVPKRNFIVQFFTSHPKGFWFFFWGEFAERCSYYGMRAILAKYMADRLGLGQDNAATYIAIFAAACYFLPLVGGYVADRYFGKYWTIVGFSIPYILGHVILGIESFGFMVLALTLLAMGSGVIKPNISTLMGLTYDQQRPGQTKLRSDAFAMFYFAINIGAAISQFAMPPIRSAYGYAIAFMFPAALMVVAFLVFAAGKRFYATEVVGKVAHKTPEERAEQWLVLRRIFGLFLLVMFFWAIFDQGSSTWIFFTEACMNRHIFGTEMDADRMQFFNPVLIMVLLPPITLLWRWLDRRGIRVRATDKMVVGFLLTTGCMGVMALAAWLAGAADLRPGIVKGDDLKLVLSNDKQVIVQGKMQLGVDGTDRIVVSGKEKEVSAAGKESTVAEDLTLIGDGVLKMIQEEKNTIRIEGTIARVEQKLEKDEKKVLLEGDVKAVVEGDLGVDKRWFVAPDKQVTVWWLVFAYVVITIAEVLISVTGLELAYTAAPKRMTGFVTACWLLTVSLANLLINAPITRMYTKMQPMAYFAMLSGAMLVISIAFVFMARRFNAQNPEPAKA
jgi:POT family proton-dependent oligopeptide transporter